MAGCFVARGESFECAAARAPIAIGRVFELGALELTFPFENLAVVFDKPQGAVEIDVRIRPPQQTFVLEPFDVGKVA